MSRSFEVTLRYVLDVYVVFHISYVLMRIFCPITSNYFVLGRRLHCELIGYQKPNKIPVIELDNHESPSSRTQNCFYQPESLNHSSQNASSGASSNALGFFEDSEVTTLDVSFGGLGKSTDIHKIRNQEGNTLKTLNSDQLIGISWSFCSRHLLASAKESTLKLKCDCLLNLFSVKQDSSWRGRI